MKNNNKNTFSDKQKNNWITIVHFNNAKTNKKEYNALLHIAIDELNNVKNENNNRNEEKEKKEEINNELDDIKT